MKSFVEGFKEFSLYLTLKAYALVIIYGVGAVVSPNSFEKMMSRPGDVFLLWYVYGLALIAPLTYYVCSSIGDWYAKKEMDKPYWQA